MAPRDHAARDCPLCHGRGEVLVAALDDDRRTLPTRALCVCAGELPLRGDDDCDEPPRAA
jgi:hypothetical protein